MQKRLYSFLRNRCIYDRVYRTSLIVSIASLLTLALVFSCIYCAKSIDWFYTREEESLGYYSDNIASELHRFDNTMISISQDAQTQSLLIGYLTMSDYERYSLVDRITDSVVEQLHMIDYVTDVVLITNSFLPVQVYRGPHGDFEIDGFDFAALARRAFSSRMNTLLADPADYGALQGEMNRDGFVYVKRIIDSDNTSSNIGYILVYIDKAALFQLDTAPGEERRCILNAGSRIVYAPQPLGDEGQQARFLGAISARIASGRNGFYLGGIRGRGFPALCTYHKIPVLNWYVVTTVSCLSLMGGIFGFLLVTIGMIVLLCLLQAFISRSIASSLDAPLKTILAALHRVEKGDFSTDAIEPYQDELATVQESLNYTIRLLDELFTRTKENERAKYRLLLQALHAQMNPHFLMNALNSVILLADLQGADNIRNFCRALSRLMQNMLRSDDFEAPLSKELSLLRDYTLIMQYRYFDRFHVEYDLAVPEDTPIPRSVLQPILENALQHGMDEKTTCLTVRIRIFFTDDAMHIEVEDDGCGIPPEKLSTLLPADSIAQEELKKGTSIGLRNIDQRLRLGCGAAYGLNVESALEKYTRVRITLPRRH